MPGFTQPGSKKTLAAADSRHAASEWVVCDKPSILVFNLLIVFFFYTFFLLLILLL